MAFIAGIHSLSPGNFKSRTYPGIYLTLPQKSLKETYQSYPLEFAIERPVFHCRDMSGASPSRVLRTCWPSETFGHSHRYRNTRKNSFHCYVSYLSEITKGAGRWSRTHRKHISTPSFVSLPARSKLHGVVDLGWSRSQSWHPITTPLVGLQKRAKYIRLSYWIKVTLEAPACSWEMLSTLLKASFESWRTKRKRLFPSFLNAMS